jgi:FtsP/CotA-like multicopper oxidase with cupredoxin domain
MELCYSSGGAVELTDFLEICEVDFALNEALLTEGEIPLTNLSEQVLASLQSFRPLPRVSTGVERGGAAPNLMDFQPKRIESKDGYLEYDLIAEFMEYELYKDRVLTLRSYNRALPAPSLIVKPGDTLRVNHYNDMPVLNESVDGAMAHGHGGEHDINHPHGFNITNLHVHGLYVSPAGNSDNVLYELHPGELFVHEYKVPTDHHSGLFWYHPHKHGSSAVHLTSGMAGSLIVTGGDDDLRRHPLIMNTKEVNLFLNQIVINLTDSEDKLVPEYLHDALAMIDPFMADLTMTVNGLPCASFFGDRGPRDNPAPAVPLPEIRIQPGELQHWRLTQSTLLKTAPIELVAGAGNGSFEATPQTLYLAACDGISLDVVEAMDNVMFASGNRLDLLIKLDQPGTYTFRFKHYDDWPASGLGDAPPFPLFNVIVEGERRNDIVPHLLSRSIAGFFSNPDSILGIPFNPQNVAQFASLRNTASRMNRLHDKDITDNEIVRTREVRFSAQGLVEGNTDDRQFLVNMGKFNANEMNFTMLTGTAEEWTISSDEIQDHPFHIHVNPIQVTKINGQALNPPRWCDTINVPTGQSVTIRHRFGPYTGVSVFHCHILTHEDHGMMALIELVDPTPGTATITPAGGWVHSTDPDHRVGVRFPARAVSEDTDVTWQYLIKPNSGFDPAKLPQWQNIFAPDLDSAHGDVDRFFSLTASRGGSAITELDAAAIIKVNYMNPDNSAITETAALYWWDEAQGIWSDEGISVRERTANSLTASTTKLGHFGVLYTLNA